MDQVKYHDWEDLRQALHEFCKSKRGRVSELAEAIGYPRNRVTRWLNGEMEPAFTPGWKMLNWLLSHGQRTDAVER
ncbi:MAG: hypothetical protein E1N59_2821 [Puniceicoccaceae bacterium 5H]|nr:MAG: hypothetical protein E1N59_2821 [Puniceicoccaceae bacterium 5H]